jgi:hypothetical protein
MKRIFVTGGLALLSFGVFAALTNTGNSYVHEDYSTMSDQPFQDSTQKKKGKKDRNRKDTTGKRDTMFVSVIPAANQLVVN